MRRMAGFLVGLCIAAVALAGNTGTPGDQAEATEKPKGVLNDPKDILTKAQAALKAVRLVRYQARYQGTAWVTAFVPSIEGSAMLGERSEHDVVRFHCRVKLTPPGASEPMELSAGSDGELYYLIDPQTKTVYADLDPAVLGSRQRDPRRVLLGEFVAADPLANELEAETIELKEAAEVGGEACYQVHVVPSEPPEVTWFISMRDWLPRRVDRLYKNPQGEPGTTQLVLTDLVAESEFRLAPFELSVPEGFTRTDEFAP